MTRIKLFGKRIESISKTLFDTIATFGSGLDEIFPIRIIYDTPGLTEIKTCDSTSVTSVLQMKGVKVFVFLFLLTLCLLIS